MKLYGKVFLIWKERMNDIPEMLYFMQKCRTANISGDRQSGRNPTSYWAARNSRAAKQNGSKNVGERWPFDLWLSLLCHSRCRNSWEHRWCHLSILDLEKYITRGSITTWRIWILLSLLSSETLHTNVSYLYILCFVNAQESAAS